MSAPVETTYTVTGMTCAHCERAVREEVEALPDVTTANVDLASGRLVVAGAAGADAVAAAVHDAGYEVER